MILQEFYNNKNDQVIYDACYMHVSQFVNYYTKIYKWDRTDFVKSEIRKIYNKIREDIVDKKIKVNKNLSKSDGRYNSKDI